MLEQTEFRSLIDTYGSLISNVCFQVEREFASRTTAYGYGFVGAEAGDIEARLYEKLYEQGVTADALAEYTAPEAVLRQYARNAARREMEFRFRRARRGLGLGTVPSSESRVLTDSDGSASLIQENRSADPESVLDIDLVGEAEALILAIVARVSDSYRYAIEGYFLQGLSAEVIAESAGTGPWAVRKALQRAKKFISPEEDAALRVWRNAMFPESKAARLTDVAPLPLLNLVRDINEATA